MSTTQEDASVKNEVGFPDCVLFCDVLRDGTESTRLGKDWDIEDSPMDVDSPRPYGLVLGIST